MIEHFLDIVFAVEENGGSSFVRLEDHNVFIIPRLLMATRSPLLRLSLGGLAFLRMTAQSCLTSSLASSDRVWMAFSMLQMMLSIGILLGAMAKPRPFLRTLCSSTLRTWSERLTTCKLLALFETCAKCRTFIYQIQWVLLILA